MLRGRFRSPNDRARKTSEKRATTHSVNTAGVGFDGTLRTPGRNDRSVRIHSLRSTDRPEEPNASRADTAGRRGDDDDDGRRGRGREGGNVRNEP